MEEESNLFSLMVSVYAVLSTIALLSSFSTRHGIIELSLSFFPTKWVCSLCSEAVKERLI